MTNFEKIRQFNGKVASKWKVPDTYPRWVAGANKLLKLHYRMMNSGLLWPELVTQLKDAVDTWEKIGDLRYKDKIDAQYGIEFNNVRTFDAVNFLIYQKNIVKLLGDDKGQTFVEETRETSPAKCHFCRTGLVKPAFIVHRLGTEIVHKSDPIGIMCLHAYVGKLKKLAELPEFTSLLQTVQDAVVV